MSRFLIDRPFARTALPLLVAAALQVLAGCVAPENFNVPPTPDLAVLAAEGAPDVPAPSPIFPVTATTAADAVAEAPSVVSPETIAPEAVGTEAAAAAELPVEEASGQESADPVPADVVNASGPFKPIGIGLGSPVAEVATQPVADERVAGPLKVKVDAALPAEWTDALRQRIGDLGSIEQGGTAYPVTLVDDGATTRITLGMPEDGAAPLLARTFAVVAPFDTLRDEFALSDLQARWVEGAPLFVTESGAELLPSLLGTPGLNVSVNPLDALIAALEADRSAIAVIGFDEIDPRYKVLTVDGANPLSNQLAPSDYPLVVAASVSGEGAGALAALLSDAISPATNRDPRQMTTLVMTGVTAMARGTADAIERSGRYAYPAEIIGPELALADITHVSNEIPFIEGCVVQNTLNNLTLCSKPEYWAALELMGTDIVGLSGNHVNDFGRDGARESLGWYMENNIPIYGSGLTVDEACAPLLWQHGDNTFAFIAALAYGPEGAWVTDSEPGACYYYEHKDRILDTVRTLAGQVDVVAVELQYEETYFANPTPAQVEEFRELRAAGADLVTGVQSHVPQAQEPYGAFDEGGPGMISYGLGNLYFDQMWSWETRSELYARHTIYDGTIINTEILTGVLEDFAQPRWATPEERIDILSTIFAGAPNRP